MRFARGETPGAALATWSAVWSARGFDLLLTRYDEKGWRATFYTTGMEHSITSATASAAVTETRLWGVHEHINVKRATAEEGNR